MSALARFLHPLPASRRTYSSFFSSKSGGGGRYFNSAKPPKGATVAAPAKANTKVDPSVPGNVADANESVVQSATTPGSNGSNKTADESSSSSSASSIAPSNDTSDHSMTSPAHIQQHHALSPHPMVNPKDFKLHQFFSLHRPLLLLSNPPSILQSAPLTGPLFSSSSAPNTRSDQASSSTGADEYSDANIDADAEAARQLTRALTMSQAGATMAWENTLRKLGLDVNLEADRVGLQQQLDREWQEVIMDSTQRKRRKKMKKHK